VLSLVYLLNPWLGRLEQPLVDLAAWGSVSAFSALHYLSPLTALLALALAFWRPLSPPYGLPLLAAVAASSLWPNREWPWFRNRFGAMWHRIFGFGCILPEAAEDAAFLKDPANNVLYYCAPHGIIPLAHYMAIAWWETNGLQEVRGGGRAAL
jgi:hypothetical protein